MSSRYLLLISTTSSLQEARKIASLLLDQKLAACVNIIPQVESHFCWKGKKEKAKEWLLLIKTRAVLFSRIEKLFKKHHSYKVPELIAVPLAKGSHSYLSWIDQATKVS